MKSLLNKLTLLFIVLSVTSTVNAQLDYVKRIEFDLKDGYAGEKIIEFGELGFILASINTEAPRGTRERKFELFDTDLESVKSEVFNYDKEFQFDEQSIVNNRIHTLFVNKRKEFMLHTLDVEEMEQSHISGAFNNRSIIQDLFIFEDNAFIYTTLKRDKMVTVIDWRNGTKKEIPIEVDGFKSKRVSLIGMRGIEETGEVLFILRAYENRSDSKVIVWRMDEDGNRLSQFEFNSKGEQNFSTISVSALGEDHYIFTGTYSQISSRSSQGLYFAEIEGGRVAFTEYYNFTDLENFLNYLPERRQERLERKKKRKKGRGKELVISYYIANHPIIKLDDGYLFMGEAYYPTYRTETYTTYSNGTPVTRTRQVFDGYQYTHAVVAKYDKEGIMQWDQIFELYPSYKPFYVKRFISIAEGEQEALNLVFANRGKITSKSIGYDGEVIYDRTSEEINTNRDGDKTKRSFSNINYWYDDYFVAYGSQVIKNDGDKKRKRKVYFISKIQFE